MKNEVNSIKPRVLLYQSEDYDFLDSYLVANNYEVVKASGEDVMEKLRRKDYDLVIIDHLPVKSPSEALKPLKFLKIIDGKVPVIMLSKKSAGSDIIEAFDEGADDYVVRPFNAEVLLRRINALLKRCGLRSRAIKETYKIGNYTFVVEDRTLILGDKKTQLNPRLSKVLTMLCAYAGEVVPRKVLIRQIWKVEASYYNNKSLDIYIFHLRKALEGDSNIKIETYRAFGFALKVAK